MEDMKHVVSLQHTALHLTLDKALQKGCSFWGRRDGVWVF